MEKSFVAYTARYPQAAPLPDMDGVQFNAELMSPSRLQQGPSPRFDGLERHGDFDDHAGEAAFSVVVGAGRDAIREQGGLGAFEGFELSRSDSDGRCARDHDSIRK